MPRQYHTTNLVRSYWRKKRERRARYQMKNACRINSIQLQKIIEMKQKRDLKLERTARIFELLFYFPNMFFNFLKRCFTTRRNKQ